MLQFEVGCLLWAKPSDEDTPVKARAYLHRPAVVLEARTHACRMGFFNHPDDDTSAYLAGSVLTLPVQWVQKASCVDWDTGAAELLRQKERHVKRVLEERCQLWIIDTEYQRVRNVLLGKEPLPESVRKSLSDDHVKRLRTKGRYAIHPVGRIRKISTVSSRSGSSAASSDTDEIVSTMSTPEPKRRRNSDVSRVACKTAVPKSTQKRIEQIRKSDTVSVCDSDIDEEALRDQVYALSDEQVQAELTLLRNAQRMVHRIRTSDETLINELTDAPDVDFGVLLASVRLAISAATRQEREKLWRPFLAKIREAVYQHVVRDWIKIDPPLREASLCIISILE